MPQTEYRDESLRGYVGEVATLRHQGIRARVLAELFHEVHVNVGGTTDGLYSFTVETPDGTIPNDPALVAFTASGDTADQITTGLTDDVAVTFQTIDAVNIPLLTNVVRATANLTDDDVELVAVRTGEPFTVTIVGNPGANLTQATVLNAVVADLPVGIAITNIDDDTARAPQAGDTDADLLGILRRSKSTAMPDTSAQDPGTVGSGATMEVVADGDVWVQPEAAVVVNGPVFVRTTATGNEQAGALRGAQDGTAQITTATPTALNSAAYELTVDIPEQFGIPAMTRSFNFTADASATATEISTGFQTAMALDLAFTARVVASGTTTLVLTGQELGVSMTVQDTQDQGAAVVGAWASITPSTPAVADCVLMSGVRWLTDGSATLVAKLSLNRE